MAVGHGQSSLHVLPRAARGQHLLVWAVGEVVDGYVLVDHIPSLFQAHSMAYAPDHRLLRPQRHHGPIPRPRLGQTLRGGTYRIRKREDRCSINIPWRQEIHDGRQTQHSRFHSLRNPLQPRVWAVGAPHYRRRAQRQAAHGLHLPHSQRVLPRLCGSGCGEGESDLMLPRVQHFSVYFFCGFSGFCEGFSVERDGGLEEM
mmetsp:Transcript_68597/g.143100  ORF Transcript_68597/g.143100 Transcript_68597/m.143100 type:complete len:201 (+) Transcript_68597:357-959(+)